MRLPVHPGQSPVVNEALKQQHTHENSKKLRSRASCGLVLGSMILLEINYSAVQSLFGATDLPYMTEVLLAIFASMVFLVIHDVSVATSVHKPSIILSPIQRKMMGMKASAISPIVSTPVSGSLPTKTTPFQLMRKSGSDTSPISNTSGSPNSTRFITPGRGAGASFCTPSSASASFRMQKTSPLKTSFHDGSFLDSSASPMLRHRRSPYTNNSPLPKTDFMTSPKQVDDYLKKYEEEQHRTQQLEQSMNVGSGWSKLWQSPFNPHDWGNELRENIYQLSILSPKSSTASATKSKDDSTKLSVNEYWSQNNIMERDLTVFIARLRRMVSTVILKQLVTQIDRINKKLTEIGCPDFQIGKSSLQSLRQLPPHATCSVPSLAFITLFLELTTNQEYLVARTKELCSGGYMSSFSHNKGGKFKGREWTEDLPTDADIILHVFCVYVNLHHPLDPRYPDGKLFGQKYVAIRPEEKKEKGTNFIYKEKTTPPQYNVVTSGITYEIPEGHSNIFVAILLFLHIIKTKEAGMLGPVKLSTLGMDFFLPIGKDSQDLF